MQWQNNGVDYDRTIFEYPTGSRKTESECKNRSAFDQKCRAPRHIHRQSLSHPGERVNSMDGRTQNQEAEMTTHKTSAKSKNIPKEPKRYRFSCPICGKMISLKRSEYRYRTKINNDHLITCSLKCSQVAKKGGVSWT